MGWLLAYAIGAAVAFPIWVTLVRIGLKSPILSENDAEMASFERKYPIGAPALRSLTWPVTMPLAFGALVLSLSAKARTSIQKAALVRHCTEAHGVYVETDDATQFVAVDWWMKHPCPTRQRYLDDRYSKMSIFNPVAERGSLPFKMYAVLDFGHPTHTPTVDASCDLCGAIFEAVNLSEERKKPIPDGAIMPALLPAAAAATTTVTLDSITLQGLVDHEDVVLVESQSVTGQVISAHTDRRRIALFHKVLTRFLEPTGDAGEDVMRLRWNLNAPEERIDDQRASQNVPRN